MKNRMTGQITFLFIPALLSGLGLLYIVFYTDPQSNLMRALFLMLLFGFFSSFLAPFFYSLESRTGGAPYPVRALRRSSMAALFLVLCAWLRMSQVLNWVNVIILLAALVVTEVLAMIRG